MDTNETPSQKTDLKTENAEVKTASTQEVVKTANVTPKPQVSRARASATKPVAAVAKPVVSKPAVKAVTQRKPIVRRTSATVKPVVVEEVKVVAKTDVPLLADNNVADVFNVKKLKNLKKILKAKAKKEKEAEKKKEKAKKAKAKEKAKKAKAKEKAKAKAKKQKAKKDKKAKKKSSKK